MTATSRELAAQGVDDLIVRTRAWRERNGIKVSWFAKQLGYTERHISRLENGHWRFSSKARDAYEAFFASRGITP